jgi:hypothetical protein
MLRVFQLDQEFDNTNYSRNAGMDVKQEFKRPRTPWVLKKGERMISKDGREFLMQNTSRTFRYLGTDGELGKFPASYYQEANAYLYRPECPYLTERELNDAVESTCGEVLGCFHVPRALDGTIKIGVRSLQSKALKTWVREGLMENAELNIAADAERGVKFCLIINGDYPTPYGGIDRMEVCEPTGTLHTGVELSIPARELIEMQRLGLFIRSDASIRVTRSKENQNQAVMTWSSTAWDGSVMTRATIKSL